MNNIDKLLDKYESVKKQLLVNRKLREDMVVGYTEKTGRLNRIQQVFSEAHYEGGMRYVTELVITDLKGLKYDE